MMQQQGGEKVEKNKPQAQAIARLRLLLCFLLGIFIGGGVVWGVYPSVTSDLPLEATLASMQTMQAEMVCATMTPTLTQTPSPTPTPTSTITLTPTLTSTPTLTLTPTSTPTPRPEDSRFWASELPYAKQFDGIEIAGGYLLDEAEARFVPDDLPWTVSVGGWNGYRYILLDGSQPISVLWTLDQPIVQDGLYEVLALDPRYYAETPNTDLVYTLLVDGVAQVPLWGSAAFRQHTQLQQLRGSLAEGEEVVDEWRTAGVYRLHSGQKVEVRLDAPQQPGQKTDILGVDAIAIVRLPDLPQEGNEKVFEGLARLGIGLERVLVWDDAPLVGERNKEGKEKWSDQLNPLPEDLNLYTWNGAEYLTLKPGWTYNHIVWELPLRWAGEYDIYFWSPPLNHLGQLIPPKIDYSGTEGVEMGVIQFTLDPGQQATWVHLGVASVAEDLVSNRLLINWTVKTEDLNGVIGLDVVIAVHRP